MRCKASATRSGSGMARTYPSLRAASADGALLNIRPERPPHADEQCCNRCRQFLRDRAGTRASAAQTTARKSSSEQLCCRSGPERQTCGRAARKSQRQAPRPLRSRIPCVGSERACARESGAAFDCAREDPAARSAQRRNTRSTRKKSGTVPPSVRRLYQVMGFA